MLIALSISIDSKGHPIFTQVRVGRNEKHFKLYKFRTMFVNQSSDQLYTAHQDERITQVGQFLRRFKLDELLQLVNVIKGDMAFVGPRPQVPEVAILYDAEKFKKICSIRPGITGPDAIAFCHEGLMLASSKDPNKSYQSYILQKEDICLDYVQHKSMIYDIKIIARTFVKLLRTPQSSQCVEK